MKRKHGSYIPRMEPPLIESIGKYTQGVFPRHTEVNVKQLQRLVADFVHGVPEHESGLVSFMGMPGVGKSSNIHRIQNAVRDASGIEEASDFFVYKGLDGKVLEVGGHICRKNSIIMATVHADNFFGAIGSRRRTEMLQDLHTFKKLWGNFHACLRFVKEIFSGLPTNVNIYTGAPEERNTAQAMGIIELVTPHTENATRVGIIEGVNAREWAEKIQRRTSIRVTNIMFNTSLEESLIRVLRRDNRRKGDSFHDILSLRLREYYFIMKAYIEPALQDPETILLNKRREIPPFTTSEREEIVNSLKQLRKEFSHHSKLTDEHRQFIDIFSARLIGIFNEMRGFTPDEIELWKARKTLTKEKKTLKKRKRLKPLEGAEMIDPSGQDTKFIVTARIKDLKREIKQIKKRIRQALRGE